MKRIASLIVAVICTTGLFAQTNKIPTIKEIVSIENENTTQAVQIVNIPVDGINHYWLHVGSMGIGNKVIQVELDPFDQLFIPLGDNITDAQMEALIKWLDKWQYEADAARQRRDDAERVRKAIRISQLRREYGLVGTSYSDDEVISMHERMQKRRQKKILQDMVVPPGQGDEARRAGRMNRHADN